LLWKVYLIETRTVMAASLELAISAIRSGRKEEGRQLLNLLIQQNPNDERAWLWMSSVVDVDEQRARCLYHVLAINPNSEIARRGLQVLGIVVSDSRPVEVPRDSQPIRIPKPTPKPLSPVERRPFLIDPQTITDELPFTPLRAPFRAGVQASPSVLALDVDEKIGDKQGSPVPVQAEQSQESSQPELIVAAEETKTLAPQPSPEEYQTPPSFLEPEPVGQTPMLQNPSEPVPVVRSPQLQNPSEPVPVVHSNVSPDLTLQPQSQPGAISLPVASPNPVVPIPPTAPLPGQSFATLDTGPHNPPGQPYDQSFQSAPVSQQPSGGVVIPPQISADTRPSQPMPVIHPNQNIDVPQSNSMSYYLPPPQGTAATQVPASPQNPADHASTTVAMSAHQPMQPPFPSPPMPQIHSNTTMGMPLPDHNGQPQHPSEPVPVVQPMAPYGQVQTPPSPQRMAFHSSSTMMMPTMSEIEAGAWPEPSRPNPTVNAAAMALQSAAERPGMTGAPMFINSNLSAYDGYPEGGDKGGAEEINILAVIIFGTLSVTALGGLGMLILLMFTTPAG
jgi:hypothetical protein